MALVALALVIALPIVVIVIICNGRGKYNEKRYRRAFGIVFEDLNFKYKGANVVILPISISMRFILLALGVVFMKDYPYF